jgi:urease beta subunit
MFMYTMSALRADVAQSATAVRYRPGGEQRAAICGANGDKTKFSVYLRHK